MKNFILATLIALPLFMTTPAPAAIGGITTNPALVYSGLGLWAAAQASVFLSPYGEGNPWIMIPLFVVGTIILDGEDGQKLQFTSLSSDDAASINLTEAERLSFNAEIDQVNSLVDQVSGELSLLSNPTIEDSKAAWESVKDLVSAETFNAMVKINSQMMK